MIKREGKIAKLIAEGKFLLECLFCLLGKCLLIRDCDRSFHLCHNLLRKRCLNGRCSFLGQASGICKTKGQAYLAVWLDSISFCVLERQIQKIGICKKLV